MWWRWYSIGPAFAIVKQPKPRPNAAVKRHADAKASLQLAWRRRVPAWMRETRCEKSLPGAWHSESRWAAFLCFSVRVSELRSELDRCFRTVLKGSERIFNKIMRVT